MKVLGWHLMFWKKRIDHASPLTTVLPRLRDLRERRDWESSTTPTDHHQRCGRVLNVRQRINCRLIPRDIVTEEPVRAPQRRSWVWFAALLLPVCGVMVWALLEPDEHRIGHVFDYRLPGAPLFLSKELALPKAKEALSQVVKDPAAWTPLGARRGNGPTEQAETGDVEVFRSQGDFSTGSIIFYSTEHTNVTWEVSMRLQGSQLRCHVIPTQYVIPGR